MRQLDIDLDSDAAFADAYPVYRKLRELGPVVWLSAHPAWAIGRFAEVRSALRADDALVSGRGDIPGSQGFRYRENSDAGMVAGAPRPSTSV